MAQRKRASETSGLPPAEEGRVWLQTAAFCDRVIEGTDHVLTLVRLVDRVTVNTIKAVATESDKALLSEEVRRLLSAPVLQTTLVVTLKAHEPLAEPLDITVEVIANGPEGKVGGTHRDSVTLQPAGDDNVPGVNLLVGIRLGLRTSGLYWFDVRCDGRLLTRVPLTVRLQSAPENAPTNG